MRLYFNHEGAQGMPHLHFYVIGGLASAAQIDFAPLRVS